ncbi:hypothetical protein HOD75_00755 [archaeon]|jgi:hypothetical protein|nr:hypothetical protein [archaeon]MBT4241406.1 hypothetical protein [archaeon]MBT4418227.1 hypothetical protein [archaeon]
MVDNKSYKAEQIKVLEGLEAVRNEFDVVELSKKIKRQGDVLILSKELKIRPRILNSAIDEGRVLSLFPDVEKSKAGALARLKTDRELKLFIEKNNVKRVSVRELIALIKEWNDGLLNNPLKLLTQEEHDLMIGSLLGDASIRQRDKNSCFRVAHSIKQKEYINYKLKNLNNFNISEFNEKTRIINGRELKMIYLSTKTHPVFNYYRNLFYKNGIKTITFELLNQLTPRAISYWVCDDGSFSKTQKYIILCTNSFSLEEHKLIKDFFNKRFGLNPTIGFRDKKYYYLRFSKGDTEKLIKIIEPFIPQSMKYKIGEIEDA